MSSICSSSSSMKTSAFEIIDNILATIDKSTSPEDQQKLVVQKLTETAINYFREKGLSLFSTTPEYIIAITGPIGVGKSTVYEMITKYFEEKSIKNKQIREYIDGPYAHLSQALLELYLAHELSDGCFQNYIQSYYIGELKQDLSGQVVIMERTMSDSVAIFCNNANRLGNLSDLEFTMMFKNCVDVDSAAGVPNYFEKNFEFAKIKTDTIEGTAKEIVDLIENDLKTGVKNRVVGLYNDPETCYERVLKRARDGEEAAYSLNSLKQNCHAYDELYKLIEDETKDKIRLFDLGILYSKVE